MDRRVARTKKLIVDAFLKLLKKKGFEKVTIQDIADAADVNRGTVYLHFQDKYDLMDYCIDSYVGELLTQCSGSDEIKIKEDAFRMIFDYLEENQKIYKLLLENDKTGSFHRKMESAVEQQVRLAVTEAMGQEGVSADIFTRFLVSGFLGIIDWWIRSGAACSAEEMTEKMMEFIKRLSNGGIA